MKISWYGTASILLESEGYRIAVDPFLTIPLKETFCRRKLHKVKDQTADAVLVTHGHFDHILDIPRLYRDSDTKIYASKTPCKSLLRNGVSKDQLHVITPGMTFTLGGFTIRVYQGRHCRFDTGIMLKTVFKMNTFRYPKRFTELIRLHRKYQENGETLFYEIEAEGKRIHLMGSMGLDLNTIYPTGADVLLLPFQGTCCPARTAAPIITKLQPKMIYLDHYDDAFPPMTTHIKTLDFTASLLHNGVPAAAMKFGKVYEI